MEWPVVAAKPGTREPTEIPPPETTARSPVVWLRMDEIDAYQDPDGLIELSPYLHVDHVPETQQDRRRFRFTISPQSDSRSTYPILDICLARAFRSFR